MNQNEMKLEFDSRSCNESFVRVAVAAFLTQLNPTLEEVADVKTAVSEAVTNAIIHGYEGRVEKIEISCRILSDVMEVEVSDTGCGIADVKQAMEPLFTTKAECDRAGMGFAFMEAFMDTLEVESAPGRGTRIRMSKRIARRQSQAPGDGRRSEPLRDMEVFAKQPGISNETGNS
ncbi:MAG: anti-sigma F factor [Lachnospiraceae bacterium]|nr:anti-sigma F factor [Lachnospiraceae bacterium]